MRSYPGATRFSLTVLFVLFLTLSCAFSAHADSWTSSPYVTYNEYIWSGMVSCATARQSASALVDPKTGVLRMGLDGATGLSALYGSTEEFNPSVPVCSNMPGSHV